MIDLSRLNEYRENNRLEAKKALGGLPESLWETYSAFANALGGVILLGVEEREDKSLHPVDLPDPEGLIGEFWAIVNDPRRTSVNILKEENVDICTVDGCRIIMITVPRAKKKDRPVYIGEDPITGSYRRNGEGDYRCAPEEVRYMLAEAQKAAEGQDG
ncbi:MAG: helix-turn-helix domain-containing protein [Christensenellales bacterium]